ncbi:MAG: NAD(P)H-quinone oxidoreductase [Actinomycetota bacterium]|nr:NAD(P)H-quinone oxidoreductase [Actinomycetota bacterium]
MRAVVCRTAGGPEVLEVAEVPDPEPLPGEVVIEVAATAVNRADVMQREGNYPPPPGASEILGLECAGVIASVGEGVTGWRPGDRVCALLSGGGYAERVAVPAGQVLPTPSGLDDAQAAALPEVVCTVWSNVFMVAALQPGEVFLVHGGGSGIGTMAIQLAKQVGARVTCTVGSEDKAAFCRDLGADLAVNYREQDFVDEVRRFAGAGADVILDNMGAAYLGRNVDLLAHEGRLLVIGLQGGAKAELDLRALLSKRGAVIATTLRSRPLDDKAAIIASVRENVWPLIEDGSVRPVIHATFGIGDVVAAHEMVRNGAHIGKVVVTTSG